MNEHEILLNHLYKLYPDVDKEFVRNRVLNSPTYFNNTLKSMHNKYYQGSYSDYDAFKKDYISRYGNIPTAPIADVPQQLATQGERRTVPISENAPQVEIPVQPNTQPAEPEVVETKQPVHIEQVPSIGARGAPVSEAGATIAPPKNQITSTKFTDGDFDVVMNNALTGFNSYGIKNDKDFKSVYENADDRKAYVTLLTNRLNHREDVPPFVNKLRKSYGVDIPDSEIAGYQAAWDEADKNPNSRAGYDRSTTNGYTADDNEGKILGNLAKKYNVEKKGGQIIVGGIPYPDSNKVK